MTAPQPPAAPAAPPRPRRRGWQAVVAVVLVVATLASLSYVFGRFWSVNSREKDVTAAERTGVAYVRPATRLVAQLVDARSSAVRDKRPRVADVRSAVAAVDAVDSEYGDELRTTQRWSKLSDKIDATLTSDPRGATAAQEYGDLIVAAQQLITKAGDTSGLVVGSDVDIHYLSDMALRHLPAVMIAAGQMVDTAVLANGKATPELFNALNASRTQIVGSVDQISTGVRRAVDATGDDDLGPNLVGHLDSFRSASNAVAPAALTSVQALVPSPAEMLASVKADAIAHFEDVARQFTAVTLRELDGLLVTQFDGYDSERTRTIVGASLAVLLLILIFWQLLPHRRDEHPAEPAIADERIAQPGPVGTDTRSGDPSAPPDRSYDLVDARQLADESELVHMGRAIRSSRQEAGGDPH